MYQMKEKDCAGTVVLIEHLLMLHCKLRSFNYKHRTTPIFSTNYIVDL